MAVIVNKKDLKGNSTSLIINYGNIAGILIEMNQYDNALYYLDKAEYLARQKNYDAIYASIFNNRGEVYFGKKDFKTAKQYSLKGYAASLKHDNCEARKMALLNLGDIFVQEKKLTEAIPYYKKAIELDKEGTTNRIYIFANINLGETYYELKNYKKAEAHLITALSKATATKFK